VNAFLTWVRPALAGLTTRGRSLLAAGLAAGVCAVVLGQRDLLRVAILLIALPLGCALSLARTRYRLALTRTVAPPRVVAGGTARVRLELDNLTRLGTQVLLAEERVPYALGAPPRFVLNRLPGGRRAAVTYSLRSEIRGRYPVGPLRLRLTDAFGMCEMTRSFTSVDALVVVPRTWPLTTTGAGGRWSASGESQSRSAAASGEDDVSTREYRHGDDLRRVHWRSTAHRGELMVRTDEQPRQMRATVILDTREAGHRGDGPASSFEWAVSTAASAAVHLVKQRYGVRMQVDRQPRSWVPPSGDGAGALLDDLAVVNTGLPDQLAAASAAVGRAGGDGLVVAVLGEIPEAEAKALARMGRGGTRGVAILLRTTAWSTVSPREAQRADQQRAAAMRLLHESGWAVAEAGPEETATQVWARLGDLGRPVAPSADGSAATQYAAREVAS
jgi:uncharacterized protein (DUF58 family)